MNESLLNLLSTNLEVQGFALFFDGLTVEASDSIPSSMSPPLLLPPFPGTLGDTIVRDVM